MILSIFSYYNKYISAFDTKMQFDDHDTDNVVYYVMRGLNGRFALNTYQDLRGLQFFKLGTFNDETGEFIADKTLLLDFDKIIDEYECKKSKEVMNNVTKSSDQTGA